MHKDEQPLARFASPVVDCCGTCGNNIWATTAQARVCRLKQLRLTYDDREKMTRERCAGYTLGAEAGARQLRLVLADQGARMADGSAPCAELNGAAASATLKGPPAKPLNSKGRVRHMTDDQIRANLRARQEEEHWRAFESWEGD
jgi:hypothetical protein